MDVWGGKWEESSDSALTPLCVGLLRRPTTAAEAAGDVNGWKYHRVGEEGQFFHSKPINPQLSPPPTYSYGYYQFPPPLNPILPPPLPPCTMCG